MPPLLLASRVRSLSLLRSCLAQHRHLSARRSFCPSRSCSQRRRAHVVVAARFGPESQSSTSLPSSSSSTPFSTRKQLHLPPPPQPPTSAYVHLPFCVKKCFYCDFPVRALGEAGAQSLLPNGSTGGGKKKSLPEGVSSYLDTLLAEIAATAPVVVASASSQLPHPPLRTISFGGGTPSLLPPEEIARLVSALAEKFGGGALADGAEVSLEADPGTFDAESLEGYVAEAGVTRLSVGVQSFDEGILRGCGRSHGLEDVERALEVVAAARRRWDSSSGSSESAAADSTSTANSRRKTGLRSWSLDLVAGLPGLDLPTWRETLRRAVAAGPDHVSVYDLQLEAGTPFGDAAARLERSAAKGARRKEEDGAAEAAATAAATAAGGGKTFTLPGPLPPEDDAAQMLREASRILGEAGYVRYEVSNYSRPEKTTRRRRRTREGEEKGGEGAAAADDDDDYDDVEVESHESRHNGVYWRGDEDYYAFGLGASSRLRGARVTRPRSMRAYSRFVEGLARSGDGVPREQWEEISDTSSGASSVSASTSSSPPLPPTPRDVLLEVAMLRLRTREGLDLGEVAGRWGEREARAIREALAPSVAAGLAAEEGRGFSSSSSSDPRSSWPIVRLTDPEGFLVSNSVISDVFVGLDAVAEE